MVRAGRQAVGAESWRRRARGGLRVGKNWRKDQVENKQKERSGVRSSWEGKADEEKTQLTHRTDCPIVSVFNIDIKTPTMSVNNRNEEARRRCLEPTDDSNYRGQVGRNVGDTDNAGG